MQQDMLSRREFLKKTGSALACSSLFPTGGAFSAQNRTGKPNVLLILVDDLNLRVRSYGDPNAVTPNLDRLGTLGVRFGQAVCQYPLCNPSRSSMLTGLRPDTTGVMDNQRWFRNTIPNAVTLPQLFRQQGYYTARVSKIFHDQLDDKLSWDEAVETDRVSGVTTGQQGPLVGGGPLWIAADGTDEDQPDGKTTAEAIRFLEDHTEGDFFLAVGIRKPHIPYIAPKKYFDMIDFSRLVLPKPPDNDLSDVPPAATLGTDVLNVRDDLSREYMRGYYACTAFADAQIGRIVQALEEQCLIEKTIAIVAGDNGYHLGEHSIWQKLTLFEESTRVPLYVVAPEARGNGQPCQRGVELVDIYPTLTDLCGLTPPSALEGLSFRPLLDNPNLSWKKGTFMQVKHAGTMGRSLRTETHRYTEWDKGIQGKELYDHLADPKEFTNQGYNPQYRRIRRDLSQILYGGWKAALP